MRVGDSLELQPGARTVRVRSLQVHGGPRDYADAPCRLALNLAAIDVMSQKFPHAELCFIESGGDNLAATFSPELADLTIYVIDVAAGEKIPRKGGPGITRADLLVINKVDLAPLVGANLKVMEADAQRMRGERPFIFTNLKSGDGADQVASFVIKKGGLAPPIASPSD